MRPAARKSQQTGQVLLRALLPAGAPDALELGGQTLQFSGCAPGQEVGHAVDQCGHECRIACRTGLEAPEQGDDSIDVDQKDRRWGRGHEVMDATLPRRKVLKLGTLGTDEEGKTERARTARGEPPWVGPCCLSLHSTESELTQT